MLNLELVNRIVLILQDVAAIAECNCMGQWKDAPGSATVAGVWDRAERGPCDGTCVHAMAKKALADIKAAVDAPRLAEAMSAFTPEQIAAFRQPGDIIVAADSRAETLARLAELAESFAVRFPRDIAVMSAFLLMKVCILNEIKDPGSATRNDQGGTREKA